jgi:hypothetical protein
VLGKGARRAAHNAAHCVESILRFLPVLVELLVQLVDFIAQSFEPLLDADHARIKITDMCVEIADMVRRCRRRPPRRAGVRSALWLRVVIAKA